MSSPIIKSKHNKTYLIKVLGMPTSNFLGVLSMHPVTLKGSGV